MTDQMNVKRNDDGNPAGTDSQPPKNAREPIGGGYDGGTYFDAAEYQRGFKDGEASDNLASYALGHSDGHEEGYSRGFDDGGEDERAHARFRSLGARPGRRNLVVWTWRAAAVGCCLATALAPTVISQILGTVLAGISLIVSEVAVIGRALEAANLLEMEREPPMIVSGEPERIADGWMEAVQNLGRDPADVERERLDAIAEYQAGGAEAVRQAIHEAILDGAIGDPEASQQMREGAARHEARNPFIRWIKSYCGEQDPRLMRYSHGEMEIAFIAGQTNSWDRATEDRSADDLRPRFYTTGDLNKAVDAVISAYGLPVKVRPDDAVAFIDTVAKALGLERAL